MSENEREIRAFEAIIASQLHRERDPMNLNDLPPLTESQKAKLNALPGDLVGELWDALDEEEPVDQASEVEVLEEELVGMNRADEDEMDEEMRNALDEARRQVIESMKAQQKEQDRANS